MASQKRISLTKKNIKHWSAKASGKSHDRSKCSNANVGNEIRHRVSDSKHSSKFVFRGLRLRYRSNSQSDNGVRKAEDEPESLKRIRMAHCTSILQSHLKDIHNFICNSHDPDNRHAKAHKGADHLSALVVTIICKDRDQHRNDGSSYGSPDHDKGEVCSAGYGGERKRTIDKRSTH
jgi:hypothetical protein